MTPEEFYKKMINIFGENPEDETYDPESAHGRADDLLCEVLESLGYKEGIDLFRKATLWYS